MTDPDFSGMVGEFPPESYIFLLITLAFLGIFSGLMLSFIFLFVRVFYGEQGIKELKHFFNDKL